MILLGGLYRSLEQARTFGGFGIVCPFLVLGLVHDDGKGSRNVFALGRRFLAALSLPDMDLMQVLFAFRSSVM